MYCNFMDLKYAGDTKISDKKLSTICVKKQSLIPTSQNISTDLKRSNE